MRWVPRRCYLVARIVGAMDLASIPNASRVILEHVLIRDVEIGDDVSADAIRTELASRPWQGPNPYAPTG